MPRIADLDDVSRPHPALNLLAAVWAALALLCMLTFWQEPYYFTLMSPFRLQLTLSLLTAGLPLVALYPHPRRWVFLALPLVMGVTFLRYLLPVGTLSPDRVGGEARFAVANIYYGNHDLSRFQAWLEAETPQFLAVMEVAEAHRAALESLPFAHKTVLPRQGAFGIALLSQVVPSKVEVLDESTPFPSLLAHYPEFRLLVTHPVPPVSSQARATGDEQIARLIAGLRAASGPPLVVMGDLNAVGWDLRLLPLREAGMREARVGHGYLPTWPVDRPILGIPIDHIYLPPGWRSESCRRGPEIGSDHYPLICDVAWPLVVRPSESP